MKLLIEAATKDNLACMSNLLTVLLAQESDFTPNAELQKTGLLLIMNDPEVGQLLVAKADGRVVGMVNLLFTISTALGAKVAILEDMVVHPDFRNKGIGNKLIEKAIEVAKERNCRRITLLTDNDNAKAHSFYKNQGFTKSAMVPFRKTFK